MKEIISANAMASVAKSKICFDPVCIQYLSLKCVRQCLWHAASVAIMSPDEYVYHEVMAPSYEQSHQF